MTRPEGPQRRMRLWGYPERGRLKQKRNQRTAYGRVLSWRMPGPGTPDPERARPRATKARIRQIKGGTRGFSTLRPARSRRPYQGTATPGRKTVEEPKEKGLEDTIQPLDSTPLRERMCTLALRVHNTSRTEAPADERPLSLVEKR